MNGFFLGLGLSAPRYPSGGSVSPIFQFLPSLPTPDAIVGDRASLLAAIAAAPAPGGSIYNIAIDETALPTYSTYDVTGGAVSIPQLDLGATDGMLGSTDMRINTGGKNLRFFPKGGYGSMFLDPLIGDGQYYDSVFNRKLSIRGMFDCTGGRVEFLGLRFHLSNTFPTAGQTFYDSGLSGRPAYIRARGATDLLVQGCEAVYGRLGTGQRFDPNEELIDYRSPTEFIRLNDATFEIYPNPLTPAQFTASISGDVMTVTAMTSGTILKGMTVEWVNQIRGFIVNQISGTPGGVGTYRVADTQATNYIATFSQVSTTCYGHQSGSKSMGGGDFAGYGPFDGHGNDFATQCIAANRYVNAPRFVVAGGVTNFTGQLTLLDNYTMGMALVLEALLRGTKNSQDVILGRNWCPYTLMDRFNFAPNTGVEFRKVRIFCNMSYGKIAHNYDSGNPHPDGTQIQATYNAPSGIAIPNIKMWGNVAVYPAGHRGLGPQEKYLPLSNSHLANTNDWPYAQGYTFENEITIGAIKDLSFDAVSNFFWNNCFSVNQDGVAVGYYGSISVSRGGGTKPFTAPDGSGIIQNSVYENLSNGVDLNLPGTNNLAVGPYSARQVSIATILDNAALALNSMQAGYLFSKVKAGSAAEGKGVTSGSLKAHVTQAFPGTFALAFAPKKNAPLNTLTTSAAAVVYGPDGALYNISVPAGIEWRATDSYGDNLSPDRAWTTAAGTVPENALLSVRATTPAIGSKRTAYMITVNGQSFQWLLQTQSTIVMPSVTLATHNVRRTTNNLTGVPNGRKMSFAVRFKLASIGVTHTIIMASTGANISIVVSSANRINVTLRNASAQSSCSLQTSATLAAGTWYTLLFSVDIDQLTRAEGVQMFLNDVELTSFAAETWKATNDDLLLANTQQWGFFNNGSGTSPMTGEFQWLFFWNDAINWRDPNQRYRLEPDYLGPKDGSAIYPAKAPAVALWGLATDNGANFGTGGTISNTGTAFAQAVAGSVPAELALEASATGATTVRVAVIGRAKPGVNITATGSVTGALAAQALPSNVDDGYVDFTFPSGGQTVTITNSAAYTNPSSVTLP